MYLTKFHRNLSFVVSCFVVQCPVNELIFKIQKLKKVNNNTEAQML